MFIAWEPIPLTSLVLSTCGARRLQTCKPRHLEEGTSWSSLSSRQSKRRLFKTRGRYCDDCCHMFSFTTSRCSSRLPSMFVFAGPRTFLRFPNSPSMWVSSIFQTRFPSAKIPGNRWSTSFRTVRTSAHEHILLPTSTAPCSRCFDT